MNFDLASLGDIGLSEDMINQMFKDRGMKLNQNELRESRSFKSIKNVEGKPPSSKMDLSAFQYSKQDSDVLQGELKQAQMSGDLSKVASLLQGMLEKPDLSKIQRKKVIIDLLTNLLNQKKVSVISEYLGFHRKEFSEDHCLEGRCYLATIDLFKHYVNQFSRILLILQVNLIQDGFWMSIFQFQRHTSFIDQQILQQEEAKASKETGEYSEDAFDSLKKTLEMIQLQFTIKEDGQGQESLDMVYAQGANQQGLLGLGGRKEFVEETVIEPRALRNLRNRIVIKLACGDNHTLALVSSCMPGDRVPDRHRLMGVDVMGWGDNSCKQILGTSDIKKVEKPVVISRLIGVDILDLTCSKNESTAIDSSGNIYEWGEYAEPGIIPNKRVPGAEKLFSGSGFRIIQAESKLYFWGNIKVKNTVKFSSSEVKMISDSHTIKKVSVGADHLLALTSSNQIMAFGSNKFSQCGIPGRGNEFICKLKTATVFDDEILDFWALDRISFLNTSFEAVFVGLYSTSPEKIAKYPQSFSFGEAESIKAMNFIGRQLNALSQDGIVHIWDRSISHRFKAEKFKRAGFNSISSGKGFLILQTPYLHPKDCRLSVMEEEAETGQDVVLSIELLSSEGIKVQSIDYPLRVGILVTTTSAGSEVVEEYAADVLNLEGGGVNWQLSIHENISLVNLNKEFCQREDDFQVQEMAQTDFKNSQIKVSFSITKPGNYSISTTINERRVGTKPASIKIKDGEFAMQALEEMKKNESKKIKRERAKAEKAMEQKVLEELELEKRKRVQKRAEGALKKENQRIKEEKKVKEEQRKARMDMRVGGGYKLESQIAAPMIVKKKPMKVFAPEDEEVRASRSTQHSSSGFKSSKGFGNKKEQIQEATEYSNLINSMSNSARTDGWPQNNESMDNFDRKMSNTFNDSDIRSSRDKGFQIKKKKIVLRPGSRGSSSNRTKKGKISLKSKNQHGDSIIEKQRILELSRLQKKTMIRGGAGLPVKKRGLAPAGTKLASLRPVSRESRGVSMPKRGRPDTLKRKKLKSISRKLNK